MNIEETFSNYIKNMTSSGETTCFTIANTTKKITKYYFTPIRKHDGMIVGGVVVSNALEAQGFARLADGKFDYIAVDSEKKIEPDRYAYQGDQGNVGGEVLSHVQRTPVIMFKANDITVNAIDTFLIEKLMRVLHKRVAIVGSGNIGFKLGLKLIERGFWVKLYRRNQEKLKIQTDCINLTKPKGTLARAYAAPSLAKCLEDVHAIVAAADSSDVISLDDLKNTSPNTILIDCGKSCFYDEVCRLRTVYRTDVGMALIYQLKSMIGSRRVHHPRFGKKIRGNRRYVCGVSGIKGDIVVQDINNLNSVIGICDGKGGLVRRQVVTNKPH